MANNQDFVIENGVLTKYTGPGGDVVIPESVKEIGENAFHGCTELTSVTIPEGVTKIGESAFGLCKNLRSVHIPKNVESLGFSSFSGCHGLEGLTIDEANPRYRQSEGVVYVEDDVLFCLRSRKGVVTVEPGTKKVGFHAFDGCPYITEIRLPDSVTSIGAYAFQNCAALERLVLPPKLKKISAHTARNCPKLTEVVFPENLGEIGKHAFESTGLRSVTLPETVGEVGIGAFAGCDALTEVTLKGGKTSLSQSSFENSPVNHLTVLGNGVSIVPSAFSWEHMKTLTADQIPPADLPKGPCKEMAIAAFCRKRLAGEAVPMEEGYLKYIKSQRKKLFPLAVREETVLQVLIQEKMLVREDIDPLLEEGDKQNNISAKAAVLDYAGRNLEPVDPVKEMDREFATMNRAIERFAKNQEEFQATGVMKAGEAKKIFRYKKLEEGGLTITGYKGTSADVVVPKVIGKDPVKKIDSFAFDGCKDLTSVTILEGVTEIEGLAFRYCSGLASVTIPESVTKIGNWAFSGCSGLVEILLDANNSVYHSVDGMLLDEKCLLICPAHKTGNVTIPEGISEIGADAFSDCKDLTSVTIPEGVTKIGQSAFSGCTGLTSVTIPKGVKEIGRYAFSGCTGLTSMTVPEGVAEIGSEAFFGCTGLTSVTIPESVKKIGESAFKNCKSLTSVSIPKGVKKMEDGTFSDCKGLTSVIIPEGVTGIGQYAFRGCTDLTSVTIPESVKKIEASAFGRCENLTIHAPAGSAAEQYAKKNGIKFAVL